MRSRRMGTALGCFRCWVRALCRLPGGRGLERQRGKCIARLPVAARRRLERFHAKCLRRVCSTPLSFISRVFSADVVTRAACIMKLSSRIRVQQLVLAGRCAAAPVGTPMREALQQSVGRPGLRNRGGPRTTWAAIVFEKAVAMAGSPDLLQASAASPAEWSGRWSNNARGHANHERPAGQWVRSTGARTWCVFPAHPSANVLFCACAYDTEVPAQSMRSQGVRWHGLPLPPLRPYINLRPFNPTSLGHRRRNRTAQQAILVCACDTEAHFSAIR